MLVFLVSQAVFRKHWSYYVHGTLHSRYWRLGMVKGKAILRSYLLEQWPFRCQLEAVEYWDQAEKTGFWKTFEESIFNIIATFIYCQRCRENEVTIEKRHKTAISFVSKWLSKAFLNKSGKWCTYSLLL